MAGDTPLVRRRSAAAIAVASLVVANVLLFTGGGAGAATLGDAGWWWRANAGSRAEPPAPLAPINLPTEAPTPPAPPSVPEGGLYVARGTDGALALGAVRFTLFTGEENPVLTLTVAAGGQGAEEADLLACATGSAWTGEEGGRWDYKPLTECDVSRGGGSVSGIPSDDGSTWTFPVAPLLIDGGGGSEVDVVIVPALDTEAPGGLQRPFEIAFEEVNGESLATSGGGADASEEDFPEVSEILDESGGLAGGGGATLDTPAGTDFTAPPAAQPALGTEDQGLSATAPSVRNATTPDLSPAATSTDDAGARLPAVAVLLAGLAAAYFVSRQPVPALRPLTRLGRARGATLATGPAAPPVGGLGRFVRPRTGPPPTL